MDDFAQVQPEGVLSPVEDVDATVAERLMPYRNAPAVRAASFVSKLSDQPPLRALCVAAFAAGAIGGSPRLTQAALRMLAAHTLATAAKNVVKRRIDRRRPNVPRSSNDHRLAVGNRTAKADTSFPSGHSAGAIAVAQAYARAFPNHRLAALTAAGVLAGAQVTRGSHYPSDVGAGLVIGLAAEAVVDRLLHLTPPASQLLAKAAAATSPAAR